MDVPESTALGGLLKDYFPHKMQFNLHLTAKA